MGIHANEQTNAGALSQAIDDAKARLNGPPNQEQLRLAQQWGIDVRDTDTGWRLLHKLYAVIQARAFVYSVVRRLAQAKWRYYAESGLNDEWVDYIARQLVADSECCQKVMDMENAVSGAKGDAWYRFGKNQAMSKPVHTVVEAARRDLPKLFQNHQTSSDWTFTSGATQTMESIVTFNIACPVCVGHMQVDSTMAGKEVICPHCSAQLTIPPMGRPAP